ncbi:MAG: ParB N-terminal domain-containing protein [Thermomicrobiales bacterium]|nr:ParB N-terminal domain-containing protein [Thermomicrobiales bacterium]
MTERVPIASIQIGERRRQDLGDIASLARNIEAHGLIHPIVVSSENELIAGERRLRAHQYLGLDTIEVRRWAVLDPDEQREIELAENLDRKDLTPLERSRNVVQLADVAAEVDRAEAEKNPAGLRQGLRGPAPVPGSEKRVAERLNIPRQTIADARQHVAAVEQYPELADLPQSAAIAAAKTITALPAPERPAALAAVPDIPEITPEERLYDQLVRLNSVTRYDPEIVAETVIRRRGVSSAAMYLDILDSALAWHAAFAAALRARAAAPLQRVK